MAVNPDSIVFDVLDIVVVRDLVKIFDDGIRMTDEIRKTERLVWWHKKIRRKTPAPFEYMRNSGWVLTFHVSGSMGGRIDHATLSPIASQKKRYGVDKSPLGAFKATRQSTQVPQGPGSIKSVRGRYGK